MQSADEALAGEDVRTLRTLAALTGGMWENKGPKWCGSEKKGGFGMEESLAAMDDLRLSILDTK